MRRALILSLCLIVAALLCTASVVAYENASFWVNRKRARISALWSDYEHRREIRKHDFRVCRITATHEKIVATMRAEFVHACVRRRQEMRASAQNTTPDTMASMLQD